MNGVLITCGACQHQASYRDFLHDQWGRVLATNMFRCPKCNATAKSQKARVQPLAAP